MFAMHRQQQQAQQEQEQQLQPQTSQILGARKRTRDDDDMTAGPGFAERRNKRPHNLPGTTDSRHRVIPTPLAIAVGPAAPFSAQRISAPACSQQLGADVGVDVDMDMGVDMDVDVGPLASAAAAASPSSSPSLASTLPSGGRIPTPIQPSFAVQLRGTTWGAGPGPALHHQQQQMQQQMQQLQQHHGAVSGAGHEPSSGSAAVFELMVRPQVDDVDMGAVPRAMETDADWHSVQNRRLPSPISEVDDCTSPSVAGTCVAGSPNMVLDAAPIGSRPTWSASSPEIDSEQRRQQQQQKQQQEPILSHRHNTWHGAGAPCPTRTAAASSDDGSGGDASTTTISSPPRKGHTRSRHTLNSWTWQPGMQKSFSIGYRADCEKCRDKVPGHFNHIIIS